MIELEPALFRYETSKNRYNAHVYTISSGNNVGKVICFHVCVCCFSEKRNGNAICIVSIKPNMIVPYLGLVHV